MDTKNCSCEKRLIGKLVLECEDERLNTTKTLYNDKKVASAKINYLIHTVSLVIICLLLLFAICVSCSFYYTKYRPKQKHLLTCNDISIKIREVRYWKYFLKLDSNDKLKETNIKNSASYYFGDIIIIHNSTFTIAY